jgi:hypothetical protein
MKLLRLMKIAAKAYDSDRTLNLCFDKKTGKPLSRSKRKDVGDTLAEFVAIELAETFDPAVSDEDQKQEARRVMRMAVGELESVIAAFEES